MHAVHDRVVTSGIAEAVLAWIVLAVALLTLVRPLLSLGERVACETGGGLHAVTVASAPGTTGCPTP